MCFGRGFGAPPATMPHGVRGFPLECRQIIRLEYDANREIENVQTFIDGFIETGEIFPSDPVDYPKFVPWEFGLVVDEARQVVIRLEDGRRVEASAYPSPPRSVCRCASLSSGSRPPTSRASRLGARAVYS